jgi:hypothetical protein
VLLEEARLRCERLRADAGSDTERYSLNAIHKHLGMSGWAASSALDPPRRQALLARAQKQSGKGGTRTTAEHALVEVVIDAEDVVTDGLGCAEEIDHLHLAHVHLLHAMDLLHTHLFASGQTGVSCR